MHNRRMDEATAVVNPARRARILFAAALLLAIAAPAHAICTLWFGGSGDWGTAGNWSLGIPGGGDTAVINSGTATLGFDTFILSLTGAGGVAGSGALTRTGASI